MEKITVSTTINEPVEKVWTEYTEPAHITKWAFADDSWHAPRAENDLRVGGRFLTRMVRRGWGPVARPEPDEARRGRAIRQEADMRDAEDEEGFDFTGTYDEVIPLKKIVYTMDDGRTAGIEFEELGNSTHVTVAFDPENENPIELQRSGWQAILENFKTYTEGNVTK